MATRPGYCFRSTCDVVNRHRASLAYPKNQVFCRLPAQRTCQRTCKPHAPSVPIDTIPQRNPLGISNPYFNRRNWLTRCNASKITTQTFLQPRLRGSVRHHQSPPATRSNNIPTYLVLCPRFSNAQKPSAARGKRKERMPPYNPCSRKPIIAVQK